MVSAEERYPKRFVDVLGVPMAYVDEGVGDPLVVVPVAQRHPAPDRPGSLHRT